MVVRLFALTFLIATGLFLQACGQQPSPQESCNFVQNNDFQRVSWGSNVPVVMYIDSSVPSHFFEAIRIAAGRWNQVVGREILKIGGWTNGAGQPSQDGANVIYFLNSWEPDRSNEQARTTVYWAGNRIYEADIRVNASDFKFFWGPESVPGRVDIESLMIHELGHVLGLAHTTTPQSVMATSLASATLRRSLSQLDQNSIGCEY